MTILRIAAGLITLTAMLSYLNSRYLRLPPTIGMMLISLIACLAAILLERFGLVSRVPIHALLGHINLEQTFTQGMLSFLLFAGAMHTDVGELKSNGPLIAVLATFGVVISALFIGTAVYWALAAVGAPCPYAACLLFGIVISPTDPVAVLGILKDVGVPQKMRTVVSAEALFNDGVGIVAFFVFYPLALGGTGPQAAGVFKLFLTHAAGGAALGAALGWLASLMIDSIEDVLTQSLITIALASGGYALASALGTSGPIAIVVAGLFVSGRWPETSEAHHVLPVFWDLLDSVLNAVLFVMIGLEVAAVSLRALPLVVGALTVPVALLARWASVEASALFSFSRGRLKDGVRNILVWGGLRGGVAVALALSLPAGPQKDLWVTATYVVVAFSILVQGTTIGPLAKRRQAL